jgi:transposase
MMAADTRASTRSLNASASFWLTFWRSASEARPDRRVAPASKTSPPPCGPGFDADLRGRRHPGGDAERGRPPAIRLLHRDGLSIRQIAKRLGYGRKTVKKALASPKPRGYARTRPAACPKLGPFTPTIERILAADAEAPKKQRHTATRLFERLRDEHGHGGSYDQVRRCVKNRRLRRRETHLLLDHPPGSRLSAPSRSRPATGA